MVSKKLFIKNASGLHARPAGVLAKAAMKCKSNVELFVGEKKIQPKSILNIMAATIKCGTQIELRVDGENEVEELEMLAALIEDGLGEAI